PPVGLQDHAAHTHSLGLRQPLKLRFPFSFFGRKLEVDVTMDVNGAFHHFVINRHGTHPSLTLYGLCSQRLVLTEESPVRPSTQLTTNAEPQAECVQIRSC